MSFKTHVATRTGVKPLIVIYSESGCGKTYSGLLLARGLAGPKGKIIVADSESGRASLYADIIPGSFTTFDLCEPFSPARYIEAVETIEKDGAAVGMIDSGSHEWEGIGGVLDMAGEIEQKSGKPGLHIWKKPKMEHQKFIQRMLRSSVPLIVCLRAKYKSRQGTQNGKTVIIRDEHVSPIQAEDFIFEATAHFEIHPDHSITLTKCSHPRLRDCFPTKGPITIEHGEAIAAWCQGTTTAKAPRAQPAPALDRDSLLRDLREKTFHVHGWKKGMSSGQWATAKLKLQNWLKDLGVNKTLDQMNAEELNDTINRVEAEKKK